MAYIIPRPPAGQGPFAAWCKAVVECLKQLKPMPGQNTEVNVTTRGTTINAKPGGGTGTHCGPARYS